MVIQAVQDTLDLGHVLNTLQYIRPFHFFPLTKVSVKLGFLIMRKRYLVYNLVIK